MYLKSIKVKNYRKFAKDTSINFAYLGAMNYGETKDDEKQNIAENTTLFVGKNNTGKTSIMTLLSRIAKSSAGSSKYFSIHDINYNHLHTSYKEILEFFASEIKEDFSENIPPFPSFEVELEIGISNIKKNRVSSLKDIIFIKELESIGEIFEVERESPEEGLSEENLGSEAVITNIIVKFEVENTSIYQNEMNKFYEELQEELNDHKLIPNIENTTFKNKKIIDLLTTELISDEDNEELKDIKNYLEMDYFNKYLEKLEHSNYVLNVYPGTGEEPVKNFQFSSLFFVQAVEANLVTSSDALTRAYNQIVTNIIKNDDENLSGFNTSKDSLNHEIHGSFQDTILNLNAAVTEIEASDNIKMGMRPALTLDIILNHATEYNYIDNDHYIPETQFGLGYTNLMLIIAKITEYFNRYNQDNLESKINIITIEEPESFMHPQMQENFINNIEKSIQVLVKHNIEKSAGQDAGTTDTEDIQQVNYQLAISTHSSHMLNNKLQTSNTFDDINYFKNNSINESQITEVVSLIDEKMSATNKSVFEFVKKHVQLEMTDIFFADAVVFVEGVTEELYIKYLLNNGSIDGLDNYHIKVYKINGAHANVYFKMLNFIDIPAVIITDMDYKREALPENPEISNYNQLTVLNDQYLKEDLITNVTIKEIFKREGIETLVIDDIKTEDEYNKFRTEENIIAYSQGFINGVYATSFEEALILQNIIEDELSESSINKLLDKVYPKIYKESIEHICDSEEECSQTSILKQITYYLQKKFNSGHKTKLIHQLIQLELEAEFDPDFTFEIKPPSYILKALEYIEQRLRCENDD